MVSIKIIGTLFLALGSTTHALYYGVRRHTDEHRKARLRGDEHIRKIKDDGICVSWEDDRPFTSFSLKYDAWDIHSADPYSPRYCEIQAWEGLECSGRYLEPLKDVSRRYLEDDCISEDLSADDGPGLPMIKSMRLMCVSRKEAEEIIGHHLKPEPWIKGVEDVYTPARSATREFRRLRIRGHPQDMKLKIAGTLLLAFGTTTRALSYDIKRVAGHDCKSRLRGDKQTMKVTDDGKCISLDDGRAFKGLIEGYNFWQLANTLDARICTWHPQICTQSETDSRQATARSKPGRAKIAPVHTSNQSRMSPGDLCTAGVSASPKIQMVSLEVRDQEHKADVPPAQRGRGDHRATPPTRAVDGGSNGLSMRAQN